MNVNEIVMIDTDKLHPHPYNPRKDTGNITELMASIAVSGVMQNLTVVKASGAQHGGYWVVIGNRRLAAARELGLDTLPCVIAELSKKEQLAIMLAENLQRKDLTPIEEVNGYYQLSLDGVDADAAAKMTGVSKKTVKARLKLADITQSEAFKTAVEKAACQITFADMERALEIEDETARENALENIGTENFSAQCDTVIREQEWKKKRREMLAVLDAAGAVERDDDGIFSYKGWASDAEGVRKQVKELQKHYETIYYKAFGYGIDFYIKEKAETAPAEADEERRERERKEAEKRERIVKLDELADTFYKRRYEFIKNFSGYAKKSARIIEFAVKSMMIRCYDYDVDDDAMADMLGIELSEDEVDGIGTEIKPFKAAMKENIFRVLLAAAYLGYGDSKYMKHHMSYSPVYKESEELDLLCEELKALGYEMTDGEKAYMDGTHELFSRSEM